MKIQRGQTFKNGAGDDVFIVRGDIGDETNLYPIVGLTDGEYALEEYTETGKFYADKADPDKDLIIPDGFMVGGVYSCHNPDHYVKIIGLSESGKFIGEIYLSDSGKSYDVEYFSQDGKSDYWVGYNLVPEKKPEPPKFHSGRMISRRAL